MLIEIQQIPKDKRSIVSWKTKDQGKVELVGEKNGGYGGWWGLCVKTGQRVPELTLKSDFELPRFQLLFIDLRCLITRVFDLVGFYFFKKQFYFIGKFFKQNNNWVLFAWTVVY